MKKEIYDKISAPYERSEKNKRALATSNKVITWIVYVVYPALLLWLGIHRDERIIRVILVPAIAFVAVTLFRKVCNCKRPYEKWDIQPLIPKNTKGKSFPSRHAFSIFMIAMAALYVWKPLGIALLIAGCWLAYARVALRVHFLRDVICGVTIAVLVGIIFL